MEELATGYGLIEGPVWDDARGLIFSDVVNGGVRALSESGEISSIVPKRRGVGGMAPHAAGGLVIGGREIIFESFDGETNFNWNFGLGFDYGSFVLDMVLSDEALFTDPVRYVTGRNATPLSSSATLTWTF